MPLLVFFPGSCVAAQTTEARTWLNRTTITYIHVVGAAEAQSKTNTNNGTQMVQKGFGYQDIFVPAIAAIQLLCVMLT